MPDSISDQEPVRLHRYIALAGLCSRRAAEVLIRDGRVSVNGLQVREMGVKVEPGDTVEVDGQRVLPLAAVTLLMNKPKGYVTTLRDERGRQSVTKLLPPSIPGLKPVGRLDMDSEGLLLFTTDGELAHRLAHPRFELDKEYEATVRGVPDDKALERLRKGVKLDDGTTAPADVDVIGKSRADAKEPTARLRLVIHEGRNRQVRRMCAAVGLPVLDLKRTRIGFLRLKALPRGAVRVLGKAEVERLRKLVGLVD